MAKPKEIPQVRALFRDHAGEVVTSLYVQRTDSGLTLLYDYPATDFAPRPGWTAEGRGFCLQITAVNGRQLTCEPLTSGS